MKTKERFISFIIFVFLSHMILVSAAEAVNTIMPLGDSITWDDRIEPGGDNRDDGDRIAYRYRLWQLLTDEGYDFDFVGSQSTGYNTFPDAENEGWPGATDDDIAAWVYDFLLDNPAKIILLHIGTNDNDTDTTGIQNILDEIDRYEADFGTKITVILARIVNRIPYDATTTTYNDNVEDMAFARVNDPAFPDNIIFGVDVDMEDGAGIDYRLLTDTPTGDMWDFLHPAESGYSKMANVWFSALMEIFPQADAGPNQTNIKETKVVTLDGSNSSDPDGIIVSYLWEQTAGPVVTIIDESSAAATFTAPDVGVSGETLTFQLTVTDNDELSHRDSMNVDVIDRIIPVANAGLDQDVKEGDTVTLDGMGSTDADGMIAFYSWTQTAGTAVTLTGAATVTATFTAPDVGSAGETLIFQLTVTDDDGLISTDTVNITVHNPTSADNGDGGGGGGGGGGGCFIATAADGSPIALHGKLLGALRSRFAIANWKRRIAGIAGNLSLPTPHAEHAAAPTIVIALVVLISSCVAMTLRKPRKKWLKL